MCPCKGWRVARPPSPFPSNLPRHLPPPHPPSPTPLVPRSGDPTYAPARQRLAPLDRAASDGLPVVPRTAAYAYARNKGVAAFGGYAFTTQSGCKCSPWEWTYYDPATGEPNGTFIGCADADPAAQPFGAWWGEGLGGEGGGVEGCVGARVVRIGEGEGWSRAGRRARACAPPPSRRRKPRGAQPTHAPPEAQRFKPPPATFQTPDPGAP